MYEIDIKLKCANDVQLVNALQNIILDAFTFKEQISGGDPGGMTLRMERDNAGNSLYAYELTIPEMSESKYDSR